MHYVCKHLTKILSTVLGDPDQLESPFASQTRLSDA
jgi:hypothetical protein